jgi:hypothetical protein
MILTADANLAAGHFKFVFFVSYMFNATDLNHVNYNSLKQNELVSRNTVMRFRYIHETISK